MYASSHLCSHSSIVVFEVLTIYLPIINHQHIYTSNTSTSLKELLMKNPFHSQDVLPSQWQKLQIFLCALSWFNSWIGEDFIIWTYIFCTVKARCHFKVFVHSWGPRLYMHTKYTCHRLIYLTIIYFHLIIVEINKQFPPKLSLITVFRVTMLEDLIKILFIYKIHILSFWIFYLNSCAFMPICMHIYTKQHRLKVYICFALFCMLCYILRSIASDLLSWVRFMELDNRMK